MTVRAKQPTISMVAQEAKIRDGDSTHAHWALGARPRDGCGASEKHGSLLSTWQPTGIAAHGPTGNRVAPT